MADYQLTSSESSILRVADQAFIPTDPMNADYQRYLAWVAQGNQADPVPALSGNDQASFQYNAAIVAGVTITSTSTPAVNGTYLVDPVALGAINTEQVYAATQNKFTNGQTSRNWSDSTGGQHTFPNTTLFIAFAQAISHYVDQLNAAVQAVQNSQTPSWPSASLTIA